MNLAPIGIITYSRIDHLKKTIDSLRKNDLAKLSELFIFIDGPKVGDEEKVKAVEEYAYTIDGFKSVHIKARKTNNKAKNYFDGARFILNKYGQIIFLEDDNIVSESFLEYMNNALTFYRDDTSILAISAYNFPIEFPNNYELTHYKSIYFNAWGFATWENRNTLNIEQSTKYYEEVLKDKRLYKKVKRIAPQLIPELKRIYEGTLNAGDYNILFHCIKNNLYTILPIKSLVNNIGHDGSGAHCGVSNKFLHNKINNESIIFSNVQEYNESFDKLIFKKYFKNTNIIVKIINKLSRITLGKNIIE